MPVRLRVSRFAQVRELSAAMPPVSAKFGARPYDAGLRNGLSPHSCPFVVPRYYGPRERPSYRGHRRPSPSVEEAPALRVLLGVLGADRLAAGLHLCRLLKAVNLPEQGGVVLILRCIQRNINNPIEAG